MLLRCNIGTIPDLSHTAQILIQRLAADAELARKLRFLLTALSSSLKLNHLIGRQRRFAPAISTALLGERDALALPLADERALELGEGAHDREQEVRHWRILTRKGEALLDEFNANAALGLALDD